MKIQRQWLQRWSLRFLSVTGTQVLVQLLSGVVAFVLVRTLEKEEYGWFTIATSMAAVLSSLNDGGIATAVTASGGEVWQERSKFSALIRAALSLLNRTALVAALVVAPLLVWLLAKRGAPGWTIAALVLLVVGPQWLATRTIILTIVNRLHSRIRQLQAADLSGAATRSVLTLLPAAFGFVNIYIAFGAVACSTWVQALVVRRQVHPLLDPVVEPEEEARSRQRIVGTMRQMYPNNVFNCIQSQLATGLLSVLGTTAQVADLGALNRLGFFFNFLAAPFSYLIGPGFARCQDPRRLARLFLAILGGYSLVLALFLGFVFWQTDTVLLLFGPKYAHLHDELFLVAIAIAIGFINQVFWTLNFSRGWVRWVWLNIPLTLLAQVTAVFLLNVGTVAGAAKLMMATSIPTLVLGALISGRELTRLRTVKAL